MRFSLFALRTAPCLSFLILAAHGLREGNQAVMFGWLVAAIVTAWGPRAWFRWPLAVCLGLGILVWTEAGLSLVLTRLAMQASWLRLALIMGLVWLLMLGSFWLLLSPMGRRIFGD